MLRLDSLSLPLDFTPETLNALILRKLKCAPEQLKSVVLLKKAVDARDKADVHFVLSVAVTLKDEAKVLARLKPGVAAPFTFPKAPTLPKARFEHPPVVVGAGPAGLFAALTLARAGVQPILIERGKPVEERTKSVQMMRADAGEQRPVRRGRRGRVFRRQADHRHEITADSHGAANLRRPWRSGEHPVHRKTARRHGFAQGRCTLDAAGNHPAGRSSAV